jgi:hypothetical protein
MRLSSDQNKKYNEFILNSIIDDPKELGYEFNFNKSSNINQSKVDFFFNQFHSEYQWQIVRKGELQALIEYLQGLPSTIHLPIYYYDIIQLAIEYGSLSKDSSEKDQMKICDNFYNFIANKLIQLKRKGVK